MPSRPDDFMPGFDSYGEFRSALKDEEEAKEISKKHKADKHGSLLEVSEDDQDDKRDEDED